MKPLIQVLCVVLSCAVLFAQEPPPPGSTSSPAANTAGQQTPSSNGLANGKERPLPSFLILGTVFNEKAISFPGVQVRVRRTDEKRFRWETYTNSRGEFAVRVFPGYEYEVVTHVKKYQDQSKAVDAKVDVQQRLSIKLEPADQGKAGAKP